MGLRGRFFTIPLLCGAIFCGPQAQAQLLDEAQWKTIASNNGVTHAKHVSGDADAFMMIVSGGGEYEQAVDEKARAFENACPGLRSASVRQGADGLSSIRVVSFASGARCTFLARRDNGAAIIIAVLAQGKGAALASPEYAEQAAMSVINAALRQIGRVSEAKAVAHNVSPPQPALRPSENVSQASANLKDALAQVPPANRPTAIAFRDEATFVGNQLFNQAKPWMLFANGYASDCFDWDPRTTPPLPRNALKNCSVQPWRKKGAGYEFQEDDGSWDERTEDWTAIALTPQLNVAGNWESQSGSFSESSGPGTVGFARINIAKISFDGRGGFADADLTQTWQSSNSESSRSQSAGSYQTDGYIIAMRQGDVTRLGYLAVIAENGKVDFLWLNGRQYGPAE